MIRPIEPEKLLEIGDYNIVSYEDNVLIVDDWYKNFQELYDVVTNMPASRWKWSEEGRNFKDYYDCRPKINFNYQDRALVDKFLNEIKYLINTHFNLSKKLETIQLRTGLLEFNMFKNIKPNLSNEFQFTPHIDGTDQDSFNCIIYFDKVCSGGTAIYKNLPQQIEQHNIQSLYNEHLNIFFDVTPYDKLLIKAKPNRMVVFNSNIYHGGFIENHNAYLNDWRINQIFIIDSL